MGSIFNMINPMLKQMSLDAGPKNVADIIMSLVLYKFFEAYSLNKGIVRLPAVTTSFSNHFGVSSSLLATN